MISTASLEWIAEHPKEAVDIISDKKYSAIEDKELAEKLVKSYEYPSAHDHAGGNTHVKEDVLYFVKELQNIGYLKTDDAEGFADQIYFDIKAAVGSDSE